MSIWQQCGLCHVATPTHANGGNQKGTVAIFGVPFENFICVCLSVFFWSFGVGTASWVGSKDSLPPTTMALVKRYLQNQFPLEGTHLGVAQN